MRVLPAYMSVYHMCAGPTRGQNVSDVQELGLQMIMSDHVVAKEFSLGLLEEQSLLLTTNLSLQLYFPLLYDTNYHSCGFQPFSFN